MEVVEVHHLFFDVNQAEVVDLCAAVVDLLGGWKGCYLSRIPR